MLMLGLNETMDQLAMTSSVHWYSRVFREEDGCVFRTALEFDLRVTPMEDKQAEMNMEEAV